MAAVVPILLDCCKALCPVEKRGVKGWDTGRANEIGGKKEKKRNTHMLWSGEGRGQGNKMVLSI